MESQPMGRFVPCICVVGEEHMPAVAVVTDKEPPEVLIESVRMDYISHDPMKAYNQALEDYNNALSEVESIPDRNERSQSLVSALKHRGYVLTPKTIQSLMLHATSHDTLH
ncbi:MAG TPA: hypothetical protein VHE99_02760 [Gammaproteobacteria bacterium]|nr:hypothetical protein [Gammaproteobacteria bacterium]